MIKAMEICKSVNIMFFYAKSFIFCKNLCFWVKNVVFTISRSETNILLFYKPKLLLKGFSIAAYKISVQYNIYIKK